MLANCVIGEKILDVLNSESFSVNKIRNSTKNHILIIKHEPF